MTSLLQYGAVFLFIFLRIAQGQNINIQREHIPDALRYDVPTEGPHTDDVFDFSPVRRVKRDADDEKDVDPLTYTVPPDTETIKDSVDHQYYVVDTFTSNEEKLKATWVDIDTMLKRPGVVGNDSHPLLSKNYRRALGSRITFKFPFYGHKMVNLTIATGGFIYIGDQNHNWLAATQYIAPLMANFHTYFNNSNIIYAGDDKMFVVEWRKVQLREEAKNNTFSFQAILHKNGDIVFAYKDVPMDISNISDANHPVKLGISDAYLYQYPINVSNPAYPAKRVIYEYHRVEISREKVKSNTVIILNAQPTCIGFSTCDQCLNATLKNFECSWCQSKKKNGGPFCSDKAGMHRRRQHWVEGNCKDRSPKATYCDAKDSDEEIEEDYNDGTTLPDSEKSSADTVVPLSGGRASNDFDHGTGGFGALFMIVTFALTFVAWLAYAYYNPHTTSGQILIKYRPTKWHVPNSHVRYSASVHM